LIKKPAVSDLFGRAGREWLREVELPAEERETVDGCLRQIDFLDTEIAEVEKQIAREALVSPQIKRLMTVPGVNAIVAATFLAAVGDVSRFTGQRQLVGYLGLDPRVRQSGSTPATHGRISKQGSASARHALVEASWSVVRQPGPLHAFYNASAPAAATRSPLSPRRASSPACSGACSPAARTTPTGSPR
jgi:transposase